MSAMASDPTSSTSTTPRRAEVAVFPLPATVFFPNTILPLHVFEPRYRDMVRDVSGNSGRIAVALLRDGWQRDYFGNPAVHEVATIGKLDEVEQLPDGRFNIRLVGISRVRLGRTVRERPYRVLEYEPIPERAPGTDDESALLDSKMELLAAQGLLMRHLRQRAGGAPGTEPGYVVNERLSFTAAVNGACSNLPVEPTVRQRLLEEDDVVARRVQVSVILDRLLERVLEDDDGSDGGSPHVN